VTDRPILFADAMVRGILNGEKTRSRRPATAVLTKSQPGDRLWVREALKRTEDSFDLRYRADNDLVAPERIPTDFIDSHRSIPSIHMPRWASRLLLTVEIIKWERLQDVDHREAMLEGVAEWAKNQSAFAELVKQKHSQALFAALWDSLYGRTADGWAENPLVVVLRFSVERRPIESAFEN
jgi:hypothetical protein